MTREIAYHGLTIVRSTVAGPTKTGLAWIVSLDSLRNADASVRDELREIQSPTIVGVKRKIDEICPR